MRDSIEECKLVVETSGEDTTSSLMGTWQFLLTTTAGIEKKVVVTGAVVLNSNLLSVSDLQRMGIKCDFDQRVLTAFDHFYEIIDHNGLLGLMTSSVGRSFYDMIHFDHLSSPVCHTQNVTRETVKRLTFTENPRASDSMHVSLSPWLFEELNEARGAFTHSVCQHPADRCTEEYVAGPLDNMDLSGRAFVIQAPLFGTTVNEDMVKLLKKIDVDFERAPHDSKYMLVIRKNQKSLYHKLLSSWEEIRTVDRNEPYCFSVPPNSPFASEQDWTELVSAAGETRVYCEPLLECEVLIMYRDVNVAKRISPLSLMHLRYMHMGASYWLPLKDHGVDFGVKINDSLHDPDENCDCSACHVRKKLLHVKSTYQNFEEYKPFEYVCADTSGPLPVEGQSRDGTGLVYVWLIMCLKTRWARVYFSQRKDKQTLDVLGMGENAG